MIYPNFIKENDMIGVTSPSDGVHKPEKINRLNNAIKQINELNFKTKETTNVRTSYKGSSSTALVRAKQLEELYEDKEVKAIICSSGGDFLLEILSHINLDIIKSNPKWLQGFSDPTGLLYTITTNLDIATIYGHNFTSFGMKPWHKSLKENLEILKGNIIEQKNFEKYESEYTSLTTGYEPYNLTKKVYWKVLNKEDKTTLKGRIIGGCLDVLNDLFGTRFDNTKNFINKYKNDGIIWYFDNCELSSEQLIRTLWKLKDNGYFNYSTGIIFGRSATEKSYYDISFEEAILHILKDLNIPIIINTDIGHVPPTITIINGAIAKISVEKGKGTINFILE